MNPTRSRLLALALSFLVCSLLIGAYLTFRPSPVDMAFHTPDFTQEGERTRDQDVSPTGDALVRFPLTERQVGKLFSLKVNRIHDADAYFVYQPHFESIRAWPEHPKGRIRTYTNGLGLRRDTEIAEREPRLRVLVAGDSHTDGLCDNAESFAGRLEQDLNERHGTGSVEVLNAASGGYSFYHYLGTLERFLRLGIVPDMFVVVVYGGNDFGGGALLYRYFRGEAKVSATSKARRAARDAILEDHAPHFAQAMMDIELARTHPAEIGVMRTAARQVTMEIQRQCLEHEIRLVVCYLPSPVQLLERANKEVFLDMAKRLALTDEHLDLHDENADFYLALLAALGIESIDLRETLSRAEGPLFWHRDSHINLTAHASIARTLTPLLERELE